VQEWGDGVVFLHRIADGAADRSYGIHVAQLAGLPPEVIERAKAVLAELEQERTVEHLDRKGRGRAVSAEAGGQLPLFGTTPHPVVEALRATDLDAMTPLQALALLAELQRRVRES
jgi:DNA mismatch repair protein MutS